MWNTWIDLMVYEANPYFLGKHFVWIEGMEGERFSGI